MYENTNYQIVKYKVILIRYSEVGLKARATRKRFIKTLVNNIKNALSNRKISFKIKSEWDRIYVYTDQINSSLDVLKKIFGISSISPAVQTLSSLKSISNLAVNISKNNISMEKSFALRVTRTGEHKYTSQDVAVEIGNDIVNVTNANVDLTKPDFELFIEIRDDRAFLFTEKIKGTGGLPLGTQATILALISNFESILAAWYVMRRGCNVIFLTTDESMINFLEIFKMNWHLSSSTNLIKSTDLYEELHKLSKDNRYDAIVTNHNLDEKPKRALAGIKILRKHTKLPILQPLIVMKRDEIINKCRILGLVK